MCAMVNGFSSLQPIFSLICEPSLDGHFITLPCKGSATVVADNDKCPYGGHTDGNTNQEPGIGSQGQEIHGRPTVRAGIAILSSEGIEMKRTSAEESLMVSVTLNGVQTLLGEAQLLPCVAQSNMMHRCIFGAITLPHLQCNNGCLLRAMTEVSFLVTFCALLCLWFDQMGISIVLVGLFPALVLF